MYVRPPVSQDSRHCITMERPRRAQRLRNAPSVQNTLSITSSQPAPQDDVPQILERSMRRLTDVKQRAEAIMGPGILVKLFAVPRGDILL